MSNGRWTHPKMTLNDYELVVVLKGRFWMKIGGMKKEFQEGDCFLLFPDEEHYGIEGAWDVSFYWLHFQIQGEEVIEGERHILPVIRQMSEQDSDCSVLNERCHPEEMVQLIILINQLLYYQSLYKKTEAPVRPCDIMMEMVLYELAQVTRKINLEKLRIESLDNGTEMDKIYDYIRANCYKNLQIAEVARQFGYNPQYFIRMFRRKSGQSPKQYMIQQQIQQAKYLFATTSLKITEVAEQVGMSDVRAFSKRFKKYEGISPSEYRKAFHKTHYNSR
ncbi:MAG: helix-turn-helix transcriptional regulator [Lachnospiraceae bacterium]|nr:AraC family transcriptional regulator [uncultured Acetatifactor sp.]MCI8542717.1 helix-turn-helix transcriptional regulator [Lachnospiraceae bacterium]